MCTSVGCRVHVGENHLLFVTRQNVGVDIDSVPTVAEVSAWSRFEGVVAPTFEGGETPPIVASFRTTDWDDGGGFPDLGTVFAAGNAATEVTGSGSGGDQGAGIPLSRRPLANETGASSRLFEAGEGPPLWFGTTTSIALEFEFFGPAYPPFPQSAHLGYRRKEFLVAPLTLDKRADTAWPYVVRTPSVLALVNAHADAGDPAASTGKERGARRTVQFFATGKAATSLAASEDVRHLFIRDLEAGAQRSKLLLEKLESEVQAAKNKLERLKAEED